MQVYLRELSTIVANSALFLPRTANATFAMRANRWVRLRPWSEMERDESGYHAVARPNIVTRRLPDAQKLATVLRKIVEVHWFGTEGSEVQSQERG